MINKIINKFLRLYFRRKFQKELYKMIDDSWEIAMKEDNKEVEKNKQPVGAIEKEGLWFNQN